MGEVLPVFVVFEADLWVVCVSHLSSCSSDRLTPVLSGLDDSKPQLPLPTGQGLPKRGGWDHAQRVKGAGAR